MSWALDPECAETRAIHGLTTFDHRDVVEIGSGDGRLTWRYADRTTSVLALDPVEAHINVARTRTPEWLRHKITFQIADITVSELPTAAFDIALLSWSIC